MTNPLKRTEIKEGDDPVTCFRLVTTDDSGTPEFLASFFTDSEAGREPRGRATEIEELRDSRSVFKTRDQALDRRARIATMLKKKGRLEALRIGDYVAELRLEGGKGFAYEDLGGPDGHMSIWGGSFGLAKTVVDTRPAEE